MTDVQALERIDKLGENGYLVWLTRRPQHIGGGYSVRAIAPGGPESQGRGKTLADAVEELLERIGQLEVSA